MNAGELKPLTLYANAQPPAPPPNNPVSLVGATCTLKIKAPDGTSVTRNCTTVSSDPDPMKHNATYTTVAGDFPTSGNYILQLIASFGGGLVVLKSDELTLTVGASL